MNDIISHLDPNNILSDQKSYEIFLIYDVAYKTSYGPKPLCISFDKVEKYIRKYDKTKYLRLFYCDEKYGTIFDRIRYFILQCFLLYLTFSLFS